MSNKTLDEIETSLYQNAADRKTWLLFTEDAPMIRRMESIGAELVKDLGDGGREYKLRSDQVLLRHGKRKVSATQRAASTANMARMRAARVGHTIENLESASGESEEATNG